MILWFTPNPTKNLINVEVNQKTTYTLTNIHGQLIANGELDPMRNNIDISSFKSGIYLLSLERENQHLTKKIIKQ